MKHPVKDWRKLRQCRKIIQHRPGGGEYWAVAVSSEGLLAVTDGECKCVHLLTTNGTFVRSIGEKVLGGALFGVSFGLKGNVWAADGGNNRVIKLSQDGRPLQTIRHASSEGDPLYNTFSVSASPEGRIYICDRGNQRVTVHDDEGKFLFAFGSKGHSPGCLHRPLDIAFGSDGLVYVVESANDRVCVCSKEGLFKRDFKTKYIPTRIAATNDNHLLITSYDSHIVMVYTLEGELIHQFGEKGSDRGMFMYGPKGICVHHDSGLVYVVDNNRCIQVFY